MLKSSLEGLEPPVLIVSTVVGRGMYSIGEALLEVLTANTQARHVAIEDFLPASGVREDLERYKWISSRFPFLLNVAYRTRFVYQRKLLRERWLRPTDLRSLRDEITRHGIRSVVCVSHRPAFWLANLKRSAGLDIEVVGLLGEFGSSLGWKYIAWDAIDAFLSPVGRKELRFRIPPAVRFVEIELPARKAYEQLADSPGDPMSTLVICGYWGQGPIDRILKLLTRAHPDQRIHTVCGENEELFRAMQKARGDHPNVVCHGRVDSLVPILRECGSVITKPGISTLLEARAAGRKIFLLRGMPVAEDNNARFALKHFGASWFDLDCFGRWLREATSDRSSRQALG